MIAPLITVLMIEDSIGEARLITRFIKEVPNNSIKLEHTFNLATGLERLEKDDIDVVLLDLGLPDSLGLETVQKVLSIYPNIPIIVLTGMEDEELGLEAVKMGAQDYVSKFQLDAQLLIRAIRYALERKKSEDTLREREELFRRVADNMDEGITIIENGNILYVNDAASEILGFSKNEIIKNNCMDLIIPENKDYYNKILESSQKNNKSYNELEFWVMRNDGKQRYIKNRYFNYYKSGKRINSYVLTNDLTEKKAAKDSLQRAFRARVVLSDCNQSLIRTKSENELLQEVSCNIVKNGGYSLAWIGLLDDKNNLKPIVHWGFQDNHNEIIKLILPEGDFGKAISKKALQSNNHQIINDIGTDPSTQEWKDEAIKMGYSSFIALPLKQEDKTVGTLNIYAGEPDAFDEDEVNLLIELAENISYGIKMHRLNKKNLIN